MSDTKNPIHCTWGLETWCNASEGGKEEYVIFSGTEQWVGSCPPRHISFRLQMIDDRLSFTLDSSPRIRRRLGLQEIAVCIFLLFSLLLFCSCWRRSHNHHCNPCRVSRCKQRQQEQQLSWGTAGSDTHTVDTETGKNRRKKEEVVVESHTPHAHISVLRDISVKDNQSLASASAHIETTSLSRQFFLNGGCVPVVVVDEFTPNSLFIQSQTHVVPYRFTFCCRIDCLLVDSFVWFACQSISNDDHTLWVRRKERERKRRADADRELQSASGNMMIVYMVWSSVQWTDQLTCISTKHGTHLHLHPHILFRNKF